VHTRVGFSAKSVRPGTTVHAKVWMRKAHTVLFASRVMNRCAMILLKCSIICNELTCHIMISIFCEEFNIRLVCNTTLVHYFIFVTYWCVRDEM